jgi:glycosyltransferase involved in cell wall biosynthesis
MSVDLSIVIPVYNEERILTEAVTALCRDLETLSRSFEILLAENGSSDGTVALGVQLAREHACVTMFSIAQPNYGLALREGILQARGRFVFCDEIDICDIDFYRRALPLLEEDRAEMVIGSKAMSGATDDRPVLRRVATRLVNGLLRLTVDFRGTDTHGLKAFRRDALTPVAARCVIDRDMFASEFVVRAGRSSLRVVEIPVRIHEKRRPAINLLRRVPNVLFNLARLTYVIRRKDAT